MTANDNKGQQVTTYDTTSYSDCQRMTTNVIEQQGMATSDND